MLVLGILALTASAFAANSTDCVGHQLDWYTKEVGETPCLTYQRLRQNCNSNYAVPMFNVNSMPLCDEQLADCCCNKVAFVLSLLCFNCQLCTDEMDSSCYDFQSGAYGMYLARGNGRCQPEPAQGLTKDVQAAVCNKNIKIPNSVYEIAWPDGSWYYTFSRSIMEKNFASNGEKEFDKCPAPSSSASVSQSSSTPLPSPSTSSTPPPKDGINPAPIVGGAVGGVVGLAAIGLLVWVFLRRRALKKKESFEADHSAPSPWAPPDSSSTPLMSQHGKNQYMLAPGAAVTSAGSSRTPSPSAGGLGPTSIAKQYAREQELQGPDIGSDERHSDGGPLPIGDPLTRSASGRLPPSYGGWNHS